MNVFTGVIGRKKQLIRMKVSILWDVNFLLAAAYRDAGVSGLHVDFSENGFCVQLNGLFLKRYVHKLLKEKDYCVVGMIFPTLKAHIDRARRVQRNTNMTGVPCMYSKLVTKSSVSDYCQWWSAAELEKLGSKVLALKYKVVSMFSPVCISKVFTPKCHL